MNQFISDICEYLATNGLESDGATPRFTFGDGSGNLKVGEVLRGEEGVFAVSLPSVQPDLHTAVQEMQIDFWSRHIKTVEAYEDMRIIYELFHRHMEFETNSYKVHYSNALGQPADLDRDGEGGKLLRLSVRFVMTYLIS